MKINVPGGAHCYWDIPFIFPHTPYGRQPLTYSLHCSQTCHVISGVVAVLSGCDAGYCHRACQNISYKEAEKILTLADASFKGSDNNEQGCGNLSLHHQMQKIFGTSHCYGGLPLIDSIHLLSHSSQPKHLPWCMCL